MVNFAGYGTPYKGFDAPQRVNKDVMNDLTNKSINWLKQQSSEQPFFLYFAAIAVHHPITPSDYMRGMSNCGPYGDFIQDLDKSVGSLIETLEYMNMLENTIIIFTSDNGGDIPKDANRPENQAINYGLKINGDLRGDKHTIYEGGTRVPFIVSWPGRVAKGSLSNHMINLLDIFATLSELTTGEVPKSNDIAPDSFSFLASLLNTKNEAARTSMVTADVNGMQAIRVGEWKYIDNTLAEGLPEKKAENLKKSFKPQLYNMMTDSEETFNVFDKHPEVVKKMKAELNKLRKAELTQ